MWFYSKFPPYKYLPYSNTKHFRYNIDNQMLREVAFIVAFMLSYLKLEPIKIF